MIGSKNKKKTMAALDANHKEPELSVEEKIFKHFEACYGNKPVSASERLKYAREQAKVHSVTKEFVLMVISPQ